MLVELWVGLLDEVGATLGRHVDGVLDAAVGDDGKDGGVDDAQALDAVHIQLGVDDALCDVLAETGGAARV